MSRGCRRNAYGAGKPTTMRMLVGLSRPDTGTAELLGEPSRLAAGVLARVGVAIDGPAFVPHLNGMRNLELAWMAGGRTGRRPRLRRACGWPAWAMPGSSTRLVSASQPGEESAAGFGEYVQVSSTVGWLPGLDVNARGLKIPGKAIHEAAGLAGDQVLGLRGTGFLV
jgi:hypothetical protein